MFCPFDMAWSPSRSLLAPAGFVQRLYESAWTTSRKRLQGGAQLLPAGRRSRPNTGSMKRTSGLRTDSEDLSQNGGWFFNDPRLKRIGRRPAREQNLSLQEAACGCCKHQAQLGHAKRHAVFRRFQSAVASYKHELTPGVKLFGLSISAESLRHLVRRVSTLAWEVDFWGRLPALRSTRPRAHLEATVADQDAMEVTLAFNVARATTPSASASPRSRRCRKMVKAQQKVLADAQEEVQGGRPDRAGLRPRRQSNLAQTEGLDSQLSERIAQLHQQLCAFLLGPAPQDLQQRAGTGSDPPQPRPEVAVGIPGGAAVRAAPIVRKSATTTQRNRPNGSGIAMARFLSGDFPSPAVWAYQANEKLPLVFPQPKPLRAASGPGAGLEDLHYGRLANNVRFPGTRASGNCLVRLPGKLCSWLKRESRGRDPTTSCRNQEIVTQARTERRMSLKRAYDIVPWTNTKWGVEDYTAVSLITQNLVREQEGPDARPSRRGGCADSQSMPALGGGWPTRFETPEICPSPAPQAPGRTCRPRSNSDPD